MRADMADRERAEIMPVLPRKSGPTQAILCVEFGLLSGSREYEKIQTYVQSYWREIDKHNLLEGPQLPTNSADFLYLTVKGHFWQLAHEKVAAFVPPCFDTRADRSHSSRSR